jgi:YVTN family beta-propeller protein
LATSSARYEAGRRKMEAFMKKMFCRVVLIFIAALVDVEVRAQASDANSVSIIDISTNAVSATVPVGVLPVNAAIFRARRLALEALKCSKAGV